LPLERARACIYLMMMRAARLEHGFHNVSRWMTWLPISLKNAAKCDKWYQLQNHSITESLNANGAREKPSTAYPVHAVFSVSNKNPKNKKSLDLSRRRNFFLAIKWLPRINRQTVDSWVIQYKFSWTKKEIFACVSHTLFYFLFGTTNVYFTHTFTYTIYFVYRPECGRVTRRT
jgi:hypothetical protein